VFGLLHVLCRINPFIIINDNGNSGWEWGNRKLQGIVNSATTFMDMWGDGNGRGIQTNSNNPIQETMDVAQAASRVPMPAYVRGGTVVYSSAVQCWVLLETGERRKRGREAQCI
jgi:hypothetical protein